MTIMTTIPDEPQSYDDLMNQLKQTMDAITKHHEWSDDEQGAIQLFDVVGEHLSPVLHNYKWRELALIQLSNAYLSKSAGIHGSDGKTLPEIESKSAKMGKKLLDHTAPVGMYDRIQTRVDFDNDIDVTPLLDYVSSSPSQFSRTQLEAIVQQSVYQGKNRKIAFETPRRAKRLIDLLLKENVLKMNKDESINLGDGHYRTVSWPATLTHQGVARHDYTVFGIFGLKKAKAVLAVVCNSSDIEQHLGHVFEAGYQNYAQKMKTKRHDNDKSQASSARDSVPLQLGSILKLPSAKLIHLDTGLMARESITIDDNIIQLLKKGASDGIRTRIDKYQEHCQQQNPKNNKLNKIKQK